MSDEVGKVHVTVTANTEEVEQGFDRVSDKAQEAEQKVGGFADTIESKTAGIRKFQGAISGAVGAVTGLVGVATLLAGILVTVGSRFDITGKRAKEAAESYKDLNEQIKAYNSSVQTDVNEQQFELLMKTVRENEKLNESQKDALGLELVAAVNANRRAEAAAKEAAEVAKLEGLWANLQSSIGSLEAELSEDGKDAAEEAHRRRMTQIRIQYAAISAEEQESVQRLLDLEEMRHQKTLDGLRKAEEEKVRQHYADLERDKKRADAFAKAIESAMTNAADALFGTGGNNLTTRLDTLVSELRQIKDDMGALR